MQQQRVEQLLQAAGAVEKGHFKYSSGRHGPVYLQCARLLQHPDYAEEIVSGLISDLHPEKKDIDVVIGPALGGVVLAYETARQLEARAIFSERRGGRMQLRRGFAVERDERVLIVEDVVTTGGSVREVLDLVSARTENIAGLRFVVNRSGGSLAFPYPAKSLLRLDLESYAPENCPLCEQGVPLARPGSNPNA